MLPYRKPSPITVISHDKPGRMQALLKSQAHVVGRRCEKSSLGRISASGPRAHRPHAVKAATGIPERVLPWQPVRRHNVDTPASCSRPGQFELFSFHRLHHARRHPPISALPRLVSLGVSQRADADLFDGSFLPLRTRYADIRRRRALWTRVHHPYADGRICGPFGVSSDSRFTGFSLLNALRIRTAVCTRIRSLATQCFHGDNVRPCDSGTRYCHAM